MSQYILSIDQGTTGTTAMLVDPSGQIVSKTNHEFKQIYPQPGWVEHNPDDIWTSVLKSIDEVLKLSGINPKSIAAIGITNQRETSVVWERKLGRPIHNAIVWQCRRTTEVCNRLKKNVSTRKLVAKKTGLVLDPYFSATKFSWMLDNVKGARTKAKKNELCGGTIDSYLIWKLTDGESFKTDVSNASRTMLMDISQGQWDDSLLKLFKVPKSLLPEIVSSNGIFGHTRGVPGLPDGIPIAGVAGDQQAALFGQIGFNQGDVKCTFGTGSFILMNTGQKMARSKSGILTTVAWQLEGDKKLTYALEGGAFVCGAAVQWLRDGLEIIGKSSEVEALARQVSDSGGVEFVPALTGLGAPYWSPEARGLISGITRGTTKAHLARATLDAMALQNVDLLEAMQKDLGQRMRTLKVDGGAASNDLLMQVQSDYLGKKIERPKMIETTGLGAAYLAGLGVGIWKSLKDIQKIWKLEQEFKPKIPAKKKSERLKAWHEAIERVL